MKLKLSFLAAALALSVTGQANAVINGVDPTGNGGLILSIWDTTTNTSYTKDLGLVMNSFVSGAVVNGGSSFVAGDAGNAGLSASWTADATLTSFLAGANAATTQWNVTATDMVGITGATGGLNAARILTTTQATSITPQNNTALKTYNVNAYYNQASLLSGTATSVATDSVNGAAGYAGVAQFGTNFGGKANFSNTAGLGQSQNFFFLTNSSTSGTAAGIAGQFASTAGASTWTLASNGALNYTVAAVPEPGEWALMLSGFGLIGFIATRRRNMNTGMMNIA
jgi:PEP-CTERM motif